MKKFLFPIVGAVIAFILASVLPAADAEAQNCPQDWHPPPCGTPPAPVKNPLIDVIKQAAKYHQEFGVQLWGLVATSSCAGSVGEPRIDEARKAACALGAILGGINLATLGWQNRLIEQINGALGGSQEVVMMPPELASFDFDTEGDPYLEALADHRNAIEYFGNLINDSVQITFDCDAWAMYDLRGIECGDNQRAWTEQLLRWQGEKYSAVSAIEDYIVNQLDADVIGQVDDMRYDAQVNGWEGWWMQQ
jgi:hypothetical protein